MLATMPVGGFSQGDPYASVMPSWFAAISDQSVNVSHAGDAVVSVASISSNVASQANGLTVATPSASIAVASSSDVVASEWIIRLSNRTLEAVRTVADAAAYFDTVPLGLKVVEGLGLPGQVLIRTSAAVVAVEQYFAGNADIATFSRNGTTTPSTVPNDPFFSQLYALHNTGQTGGTVGADIDATAAWNVTTGSQAVVVGVIDTGIDYTHPDLAANVWTNPGEIPGNGIDDDANGFVDDVHGYDFANDDGDPMDDHGHGTHVSGTIGAVGDNGTGVTGVSWNVSLMALKFLDASGSGWDSDAIRAINYATMMRMVYDVNVRVTNNSWGGGTYDAGLLDAINAGGAAGIMFVAAAGNNAQNADASPSYPAAYDSPAIVSVAATDSTDSLAWFSNYGPTSVDVAAPGVNIISTLPGNRYGMLSGTSMATPHVSGVAALALAVDPTLTVAQLKGRLLGNVDPIPGLAGRTVSGGRLNAAKVVNSLLAGGPAVAIAASKTAVRGGEAATITFTLTSPSTTFDVADVAVTGGTVAEFVGSGSVYTATFTALAGYSGPATVSVAAGCFTDERGNVNFAGALPVPITVDSVQPTVAITSSRAILKAGATSVITFRLSESATNFTAADVIVTGGVLSGFTGTSTMYTATFTPTPGSDGFGTIAVDDGSFTDSVGNPNTAGMLASAIRIDVTPPTIVITASTGALKVGDTAVLTFTLSETPVSFTAAMVTVAGGSLSGFAGSGTVYTATFTPTANFTGYGIVTVAAGRCADAAGNANASASLTPSLAIDTKPPTLRIATSRSSLKAGETAVLTFTLSESVADFTVDDVTVVGGVLSDFAGSDMAYTATFTPTPGYSATGTVTVPAGKFTDAAGNVNTQGTLSPSIGIDARPPTLAITSSLQTVKFGTTAVITFRLSESTTTFTAADVIVTGGTLSNFTGTGAAYSAIFTPTAGLVGIGTVSVDAGAFTDTIGNPSLAGSLVSPLRIDMIVPTIAIVADKTALRAGESAVLTFTLSEAPTSFTAGMVTVAGGTLSGFAGTGTTYTARFTPAVNTAGSGTVVVNAGRFRDAAGNGNMAGSLAPSIAIDTKLPTVAIASSRSIVKGGETATLTFTLSESASDFAAGDVAVAGGTLSDFAGSGTLYTATFTPTVGFTGSGAVTVAAGTFTDAAGNGNVRAVLSPSMIVDTKLPSLTISSSLPTLKAGAAAVITFRLSESTTSFTAADVAVTGGTLSNFAGTGATYTATFTPTPDLVGMGTVTVAAGTFTDAVGNANLAGSLANALRVDTIAPTIAITSDRTTLKAGETALLRFTLDEVPASFTAAMVTVSGGTLSSFVGSGTLYTAKFTPAVSFAGFGTVTVAAGKFTDVAGNGSVAGSLSPTIAIDTILPTVAIAASQASLKAGETAVFTFTLSESAVDFAVTDVTVTRGTLSNFAGSGTLYTATFTPTAGVTGAGTVTVAAGKFTDAAGNANAASTLPGGFAITA